MKRQIKTLAYLAVLLATLQPAPSLAQDSQKLNSFWDNLDKKYPNLNKIQQPGKIGQPGTIQAPQGEWQQVKEIDIPKAEKAVTEKKQGCQQRVVVCSDTLFNFNESTLRPSAEAALRVVGPKLKAMASNHPVTIEGHTDSVGSDDYNQALSERRAAQVKNWLVENKYIGASAQIKGYGEKKPVAENTTPDGKDNPKGRALNRRVELAVDTCKTVSDASAPDKPELNQAELERISNLLPSSNLYSEGDQKTLFTLTHLDALSNPELRCDLLVPTDWKLADVSASADLVKQDGVTQVPLAQIAPATGDDVATEIRYQRVPASVSPQEFVSLYAKAAGMTVIAQQQVDFNGRAAHDALLKSTSVLTGNMLSRMTVFRRGAYLFMVVSTAQESDYPKWKRIFGAAASSFDPGTKVDKPGATAANQ